MKIAVIGSRNAHIDDLTPYLPADCTEIVSGGAKGIDTCAAEYARAHRMILTEFRPQYEKYGRAAPILRNRQIVDYADSVIAIWDGKSRGTASVIEYCQTVGKACRILSCSDN